MEVGQHNREQEMHDLQVDDHKNRQAHAAVNPSLKDTAKEFGAGSKALHIEGQNTPNPINSDIADE
jgi:hypothetical protein